MICLFQKLAYQTPLRNFGAFWKLDTRMRPAAKQLMHSSFRTSKLGLPPNGRKVSITKGSSRISSKNGLQHFKNYQELHRITDPGVCLMSNMASQRRNCSNYLEFRTTMNYSYSPMIPSAFKPILCRFGMIHSNFTINT